MLQMCILDSSWESEWLAAIQTDRCTFCDGKLVWLLMFHVGIWHKWCKVLHTGRFLYLFTKANMKNATMYIRCYI